MKVAGGLRESCLLFVLSAAVYGQVNTATVSGSVTDPTRAQVPGAQLQLQNELTGRSLSVASNSAGQFTFSFVPVGEYTLTAKQSGFQDQVRRGLNLSAGESLSLDVQLQLSSSQQEVTVVAVTPLLDLASSDQHQTIDKHSVYELPLAKLDWTNLLKLGNGITKAGTAGLSMNGLPPASFLVTVD